MVSKFCPLDIGNRFIEVIDKDGKAVPDVLAHDVIVEGIRHEAERVLYGDLRELVLSNFNRKIKQSRIPLQAYAGEETKASHLVLECQAGELKYKYTTGVIVMFKSGVYSGSYYSQN
ncbi:hypothetical protein Ddc_15198 [Ditylenchus destructor]|nr:hypothetical protein Ddc_15198 [Ditylenchus destructor]